MTRTPLAKEVRFTVPLTPPSVNHYKMRTRKGVTFVSAEARAYKDAVAICARGAKVDGKEYSVTIIVTLGAGQKGDIDNFAKCAIDALVSAGVIHSDAAVTHLEMAKRREPRNARTEYVVQVIA